MTQQIDGSAVAATLVLAGQNAQLARVRRASRDALSVGSSEQVDVLIVGAGPCGLVAGMTLARGIDVMVVEQRQGGPSLLRALVVSTRGMGLCAASVSRRVCVRGQPPSSPRPW
jgi:NADPH-dependent 2,4-dienoyl-CoA reductase/sulfur reductase-like enzyme